MLPPPKHVPFFSIYRENFEVVEERHGHVSLYPHTEQLPLLLRALNLEFYGKLPDRIARVDHRGDGFHKIVLHQSAMLYCQGLNRTRADRLKLFDLPDANLVTKISIVQHITEDCPRGLTHRFRFYAGSDFFPEIRLSGRRLLFADHVLQRFSSRVPNYIGEDLGNFLEIFYGSALISLPCGPGRAFMIAYNNSILAFPYREEMPGEYFITTCLTINEMHQLSAELPPCVHNFHYATDYTSPKKRHWLTPQRLLDTYGVWTKKSQMKPLTDGKTHFKWDHKLGLVMRDATIRQGFGPGSSIFFLDNIPGPHLALVKPGNKEVLFDELECCQYCDAKFDWAPAFARRDAILAGPHAAPATGTK